VTSRTGTGHSTRGESDPRQGLAGFAADYRTVMSPTNPDAAAPSPRSVRLAGFYLFLLAAQFMLSIMLAASMAPGYDIRGGAISDLGVIPETAVLFNGTLLAVGILNAAGGYLLHRARGSSWIVVLFGLAGVGAAGAGLIPLDRGDVHGLFALIAFVAFNVEVIGCTGMVAGPMRWLGLVAGLTGLAFVVVMVTGDSGNAAALAPLGHGGTERMIVYPAMLWMLGFGGYLMGSREGGRS
jgi:hypothetical membrane protein